MPDPKPFLYLQIAETIRRWIVSGELKPGDKLPPVREMAQRWRCTPGTVSRSYAVLANEGLVAGHRGRGTLVAPSSIQQPATVWDWAALVNRAEQFLLEAIGSGHEPVEVETALSVAVSRWSELKNHQDPHILGELPAVQDQLRFAGSHDLIVEWIARLLGEQTPKIRLSIEYLGSLGGLMALNHDEADVAGVHLWDEASDTYNVPFIQRVLPGRRCLLLTLAHRSLGLIIPSGNPQQLQGLIDLLQPGVRFVNRQPGSGTRIWLDAQLKKLGISLNAVPGFDREELTHLAVARAVSEGEATVGLGIYAAANSFGLEFTPLTKERYDLVIPERVWGLAQTQVLAEVVRSEHLKQAIAAIGGYDTEETGRETWVG
jgi:molybdate-binding protein/DNA-binding transcriptional regulator YhcF (GntR family)